MTYNAKKLSSIMLVPVLLISGGCVLKDYSDLEAWTEEVDARPGGRISPLPEFRPYEAYAYQSADDGLRDPFDSFYRQREEKVAKVDEDAGLTPEMEREIKNRNREELEQFELDSLRMVGTLQDDAENWGVIIDPDGSVHRVKTGNYLGRNIGKIINIFEDRLELREIIKNSQGRWEEREAAIALVEVE